MNQIEKIKQLRQITQAGFLDCKKALEKSDWNIDKAIAWLKKEGISKANKKESALASEGIISIISNEKKIVMYEVNSQTDFVSSNQEFLDFVDKIGVILIKKDFENIKDALTLKDDNNQTINDLIIDIRAIIGEKITLRRVVKIKKDPQHHYGIYLHTNKKIGAIMEIEGANDQIARNIAMHVASMNPPYLNQAKIDAKKLSQLKKEIDESPILKDKPAKIKENIANGMLSKELSTLTLVDQEFVMEKIKVKDYLKQNQAKEINMYRLEVGEGLEHKTCDFAQEVEAEIKKSKSHK